MIDIIEVLNCHISEIEADAVLTGVFEDSCESVEQLCGADDNLRILLNGLVQDGEITGKLGTTTLIHSRGEIVPKRILMVGMGKLQDLSLDRLRGMAATSGRMLRDISCKRIGIHLGFLPYGCSCEDIAMAVIEGFLLGQYRFDKYKPGKEKIEVEKFGIYFPGEIDVDTEEICDAVRTGAVIAMSTNYTRDICNEPANVVTPVELCEIASKLAEENNFKLNILDEREMEGLGMDLLLSVAKGSTEPPRLIIAEYMGGGEEKPVYGLLGKGVTFDSGGISLKDQSAIDHMHMDKTAGAIVLGILEALASLNAKINLVGVIPAVENMPGGNSYKPGDIIRSMSGKTVEIINTDAEGRLIMVDALTYMQRKLNIKNIIDLATLTGGSKVALGPDIIPIFSNDKEMTELFKKSCWHSGEACWEMPLYRKYLTKLESQVAHLKNHTADPPTTILAALFLSEFIDPETEWMHLDIGGHEFRGEEFSYQTYGATALGMRSLIRYFLMIAEAEI